MSWDDPDEVVDELNSLVPKTETPVVNDTGRLEAWLRTLVERRGADLLLVAGSPPGVRIDGEVSRLEEAPLDGEDIELVVRPALPSYARDRYDETRIADASWKVPGLGRFRINLHHERGRPAATIRALPTRVPGLASLNLPSGVEMLSRVPHGLVVIGGATGSGKSTTLAAIVHEINRRDRRHLVTIEDPIERDSSNAGRACCVPGTRTSSRRRWRRRGCDS